MKKIVPFKKEIAFKTNIAEITSISLEHTLKVEDYLIDGDFIVSGEYKMADISTNTENFNFDLPFHISIDEKYLLDKVVVDIDDFYYEIINDRTLVVNIDVLINNLEEKPLIEVRTTQEDNCEKEVETKEKALNNEIEEEKEQIVEERKEEKTIEEAKKEETIISSETTQEIKEENPIKIVDTTEAVASTRDIDIFNSFTETENFATYRVYIVREGDMVDGILEKYGIARELLEKYNDLNDVKIGDKLIIPSE